MFFIDNLLRNSRLIMITQVNQKLKRGLIGGQLKAIDQLVPGKPTSWRNLTDGGSDVLKS